MGPLTLQEFLSESTNAPVSIQAASIIPGGASLETWAVTAEWGGQPHELIVRRDTSSRMVEQALSRADEFALLELAHRHGVRVPRPLFLNEGDQYPYFVMERLDGISIGAKVVRDPALASAREELLPQLAAQLAKIHDLSLDPLPFLPRPAGDQSAAGALLAILKEKARQLDPASAVWAFGLRWLERNVPPDSLLTVVHGDFRVGNFLVTPQGLNGVLDWEFAHAGDPAEDLAWIAVRDWRFGIDHLPVGGIGSRKAWLDAYRAAGGYDIEPHWLRWWEIAGNLKWAIFCLAQADRHLSGKEPNVEYAALGRRSAEMEWEMLRQIESGNEWDV